MSTSARATPLNGAANTADDFVRAFNGLRGAGQHALLFARQSRGRPGCRPGCVPDVLADAGDLGRRAATCGRGYSGWA